MIQPKSSPLARKYASRHGLDIRSLGGMGTGPGGRIMAIDILTALSASTTPTVDSSLPIAPLGGEVTSVEEHIGKESVSGHCTATTSPQSTESSLPPSPTSCTSPSLCFLSTSVDAEALFALCRQVNREVARTQGHEYKPLDFITKALVASLQHNPDLNAHYDESRKVTLPYALLNLGYKPVIDSAEQVGGDHAKLVVLPNADKQSVLTLSRSWNILLNMPEDASSHPSPSESGVSETTEKATATLSLIETRGGSDQCFFNEIPSIQTAVLVLDSPVSLRDTHPVDGAKFTLSLTLDKRAVSEQQGTAFLAELKKLIETPTLMLI